MHLRRRMVLQGLAIDGPDFPLGALADTFVKALAAFFAEISALQHALHEFGHQEAVAGRIVRRQFVQVAQHVHPDVEPHDVNQPETGAPGQADEGPGERVDLFDGVVALDGKLVHGGAEEAADAIGDEVGSIFARHHAFPQVQVAKRGGGLKHLGQR